MDILLDSGASVSVMSSEIFPELFQESGKVSGIGGMQRVGKPVECKISISSTWSSQHSLKPMSIPGCANMVILGRDFLTRYGTTEFDWANRRVRLGIENDWIFMVSENHEKDVQELIGKCKIGSEGTTSEQQREVKALLEEFCTVFVKNSKAPKLCTTEVHRIMTQDEGRICRDKVRRLPDKWKGIVADQIKEMLQNDIISPSNSAYNSNPLLVDKKDSSKRFAIDFRSLNKSTIPDSYPLPDVDDMIDTCFEANFFTQLDLASGYWCLAVHEDDRCKTAFSVPNGKYEFKRMPFGLKNSQATFQRMMDRIVVRLHNRGFNKVLAFVDNILIFSEGFEEHLEILRAVFEEMVQQNLSLRPDKCEVARDEIDFMGYHLGHNKVGPCHDNVRKLVDFPAPKSKKQIQRFLGIANFNRRFIPKYAEITKPLTRILSDKEEFVWGAEQESAMDAVKDILSVAPALGLPNFSKEFYIQSDASDVAVGGMLFQLDNDKQPIVLGYHSKTLNKSQKNWRATEKEMFGVISCSRKWATYCTGRTIFITDHEPLKFIRKHKDNRGKLCRWILELEPVDYEIRYIPGKDNVVADALSRVRMVDTPEEDNSCQVTDDFVYQIEEIQSNTTGLLDKVKQELKEDSYLKWVTGRVAQNKSINKGTFRNVKNLQLKNGLLLRGQRIVIPESMQEHIIEMVHGQHHLGVENTTLLIKARFWWRRMGSQIERLVQRCRTCTSCKVAPKPHSSMVVDMNKVEPRESIAIDIASMPISPRGNLAFLLIVDLATKFVSVAILACTKAHFIETGLWSKWFSIFGIPKKLRSDQGQNVDGKVIRRMCDSLEIQKGHSTPYHPEGNGAAERAIGSIKILVSGMCESRGVGVDEWDTLIHEAVLAHNTATNKSLQFSPFRCMLGEAGRLPIDNFLGLEQQHEKKDKGLVLENAHMNRLEAHLGYKQQKDKGERSNEYQSGDLVLIKRTAGKNPKLEPNWIHGPYTIEKKIGPVNYSVRGPKGGSKVYHHNMLKPALEKVQPSRTPWRICEGEAQGVQPAGISLVSPVQAPTHTPVSLDSSEQLPREASGSVAPPSANVGASYVTRSGRSSRPVPRLGIND